MFDPTLPADATKATAVQMRGQFNGLKDLIDGTLVGPPGPPGVDGAQGEQGVPGPQGPEGPPGPPFIQPVVDGVSTMPAGSDASASSSFDGTNLHFAFGLPQGAEGSTGPQGSQGSDGPQGPVGPQGLPGEVTNADLAAALATTSTNTNAVALLGLTVSDPPTQAEMQSVADKLEELITALRR